MGSQVSKAFDEEDELFLVDGASAVFVNLAVRIVEVLFGKCVMLICVCHDLLDKLPELCLGNDRLAIFVLFRSCGIESIKNFVPQPIYFELNLSVLRHVCNGVLITFRKRKINLFLITNSQAQILQ